MDCLVVGGGNEAFIKIGQIPPVVKGFLDEKPENRRIEGDFIFGG